MDTYIGYSTDTQIRKQATSGGVGSAIVKYLLDTKKTDYALSFDYDSDHVCYKPKFVSHFSDYNICGSIYQEMNLIDFMKSALPVKLGGVILVFSLPCQTKVIRKICSEKGYKPIIVGLTCSSQQSHEATSYLLQRIGIDEDNVAKLRYRGNGWPSGIQICTKDGNNHFVKNNGSLWTEIFHSRLFIQPRCYLCNNTLNDYADIVLADPWLKEYTESETIGQTLFACYTETGKKCIDECLQKGYIAAKQVNQDLLYRSQKTTIERKKAYKSHPNLRKWMRRIFLSRRYKLIVKTPVLFRVHCKLRKRIEQLIT